MYYWSVGLDKLCIIISVLAAVVCYYDIYLLLLLLSVAGFSDTPIFQHSNIPTPFTHHLQSFTFYLSSILAVGVDVLVQVGINATRTHFNDLALSIVRESEKVTIAGGRMNGRTFSQNSRKERTKPPPPPPVRCDRTNASDWALYNQDSTHAEVLRWSNDDS